MKPQLQSKYVNANESCHLEAKLLNLKTQNTEIKPTKNRHKQRTESRLRIYKQDERDVPVGSSAAHFINYCLHLAQRAT